MISVVPIKLLQIRDCRYPDPRCAKSTTCPVLLSATSGRLINWLVRRHRDLSLTGYDHPVYHDAIRPIPSRFLECIYPDLLHVLLSAFYWKPCGTVHVALAKKVERSLKIWCNCPGTFGLTSSLAHTDAEHDSSLIFLMRSRRLLPHLFPSISAEYGWIRLIGSLFQIRRTGRRFIVVLSWNICDRRTRLIFVVEFACQRNHPFLFKDRHTLITWSFF